MRALILIALTATLSGCSSVNAEPQIVQSCAAEKRIAMEGQINCLGGDPAVVAGLPDWAKPPAGVKLRSTSVSTPSGPYHIGYVGEFQGPMSQIKPLYIAQLKSVPEMNARDVHPALFLARKDGDPAGSMMTLTEQGTSAGEKLVEIQVLHRP